MFGLCDVKGGFFCGIYVFAISSNLWSTSDSITGSRSDHILTTNEPRKSSFMTGQRPLPHDGLSLVHTWVFMITVFSYAEMNRNKEESKLESDLTRLNLRCENTLRERFLVEGQQDFKVIY